MTDDKVNCNNGYKEYQLSTLDDDDYGVLGWVKSSEIVMNCLSNYNTVIKSNKNFPTRGKS